MAIHKYFREKGSVDRYVGVRSGKCGSSLRLILELAAILEKDFPFLSDSGIGVYVDLGRPSLQFVAQIDMTLPSDYVENG